MRISRRGIRNAGGWQRKEGAAKALCGAFQNLTAMVSFGTHLLYERASDLVRPVGIMLWLRSVWRKA